MCLLLLMPAGRRSKKESMREEGWHVSGYLILEGKETSSGVCPIWYRPELPGSSLVGGETAGAGGRNLEKAVWVGGDVRPGG